MRQADEEQLAVLGYSCGHDDFAFNFTSSPMAKKIISDFIAANVKVGRVVRGAMSSCQGRTPMRLRC